MDETPRIGRVIGEFFKKGPCTVCGKGAERTKSIAGDTYESMMARGQTWTDEPIMHKRCES